MITITNNKRVILEIMTSTKLLQHTLPPPVDQTWSTGWVGAQIVNQSTSTDVDTVKLYSSLSSNMHNTGCPSLAVVFTIAVVGSSQALNE